MGSRQVLGYRCVWDVLYLVTVVLFGVVGGRHHDTSTETQMRYSEWLRGRKKDGEKKKKKKR